MSPIYQANAIARDKRGREIASRYPLWRGEVQDLRVAASAAGLEAKELADDPRVDTVVISISGPKAERLTATEYGDDLRAGGRVTADQSNLIADSQDDPDAKRAAIERIKDAAVAAMPKVAQRAAAKQAEQQAPASGETASVPATDPLQDFFGPGWKPKEKKPEPSLDIADATWPAAGGGPTIFSPGPTWSPCDGKDMLENLKKSAEQMRQMHAEPESLIVGERAWRAIVEQLRVTGQLPSGAGKDYTGPVEVDGVPVYRSGKDNEKLEVARKPRDQKSSRRKASKGDVARFIKAGAKLDPDQEYEIETVLPRAGSLMYIYDEALDLSDMFIGHVMQAADKDGFITMSFEPHAERKVKPFNKEWSNE